MNPCYILCNGCQKWLYKMLQQLDTMLNKENNTIKKCAKNKTNTIQKENINHQNHFSTLRPIPRPTLKSIATYHV